MPRDRKGKRVLRVHPARASIAAAPAAGPETNAFQQHLLAPVHEEIVTLAALEADWDSNAAEPPSNQAIAAAHLLVDEVGQLLGQQLGDQVVPYDITPTPRGGVHVEWRGRDQRLQVEIGPECNFRFLIKPLPPTGPAHGEAQRVALPDLLPQIAEVLLA